MAAPPSVQRVSFFTRQDHARRQTVLLVFLLMVAVALIVLALNVAVYLALVYTDEIEAGARAWLEEPWPWAITIVTVVAILTASLARLRRLRSGGTAVAEMVGARPVDLAAWIPSEKRLINVVEAMAISSGIPVPRLYILDDEQGINAFVAGYKPTEAVMVVTRGALEKLERNELQGLVAHEFSHILNGDMRLNIRLMAILAGITIIGTTGRVMLNPSRRARGSSRVRSSSRSGGAKGPGQFLVIYMAIALSLLIIGYIGLFFGRIIKAAVSRQRLQEIGGFKPEFHTRSRRHRRGTVAAPPKPKGLATPEWPRGGRESYVLWPQHRHLGSSRYPSTHRGASEPRQPGLRGKAGRSRDPQTPRVGRETC